MYPRARPNESAAIAIDVAVALSFSPNQSAAIFAGKKINAAPAAAQNRDPTEGNYKNSLRMFCKRWW